MKGWYGDKHKHFLASKGIKTKENNITFSSNKINNQLLLICNDESIDCKRIIKFLMEYNIKPTSVVHIAQSKDLIKYYDGDEEIEYDFTSHYDDYFNEYEEGYPFMAKRRNYDTEEPEILVASDFHDFRTDQVIISILHEHGHTLYPYKSEDFVESWAYNEYLKWYKDNIGDDKYERLVR